MATIYGQLAAVQVPGTATLTDVYTVPASKKADVNIRVTNSLDTNTNISIVHVKSGTALDVAPEDYIYGGSASGIPTLKFNDNRAPLTISGLLMTAGDTVAVYSSNNACAAQINGIEGDA